MRIEALRLALQSLGAKREHEQRVLRHFFHGLPPEAGRKRLENFLPAAVRAAWPQLHAEWEGLARIASRHPGEDGSERLLVELADGLTVESVLLPRDGVCVSAQIGCAVGCVFCMTGREGLIRQLGSAEIVAQVALARRLRPVKRVVFMGMGEPAHNLENVLEAIELLGTVGGIGHKNLVFSTVGDPRVFERLAKTAVKPALALSLHTTRADLRAQLLPRAPAFAPHELVLAGQRYARATGYPVQVQWTLLAGINDGDEEIETLAEWLQGGWAVLNFIPYNSVEGLPYARPDWEQAAHLARRLHQRGVLTKLRHSAGQDVDGGCGQLRARALSGAERGEPIRWVRRAASLTANQSDCESAEPKH